MGGGMTTRERRTLKTEFVTGEMGYIMDNTLEDM